MSLTGIYQDIKFSIVAFCPKYPHDPRYAEGARLPDILGTGFIFDSCGLILTNQHVVNAFKELPRPTGSTVLDSVYAIMFDQRGREIRIAELEIVSATEITSHLPSDKYFERRAPDIALVGVNVKDLPSCRIRTEPGGITEGLDVATAGFPMGRRGLVDPADGLIQQLSPVLQRGIIGAVQPFAHDRPLSFTINILLQNGASGSPVFSIDTGEVLGVAFQRRFEPTNGAILDEEGHEVLTADGKKMRTVVGMPTNYSFVVPTYRIAGELPKLRDDFLEKSGDQQISFKDYYNGRSRVDMTTGEVIKNIQSIGPNHYIVKRSDIE